MGKLLKNYNDLITSYYGNRQYTLNGQTIKDFHIGIDIGGNLDYIKAFESGTVETVVNNINGYVGGGSYGNYIIINHGNGYKTRYAHLKKGSITVKVGSKVNKGDVVGYMGATGTVTGAHLHFEVIINGNTVDPLPYHNGTKTFNILQVTATVSRNENNNQLKVNVDDLRVRKSPATNQAIIGLAKLNGIYNYYETKVAGGYTWYRIADGQWIANSSNWCTIYPKKVGDKDRTIAELNNTIKEKDAQIKALEQEIQVYKDKNILLEKENNNIKEDRNTYLVFEAPKQDNYFIRLNEREKLIYKKS